MNNKRESTDHNSIVMKVVKAVSIKFTWEKLLLRNKKDCEVSKIWSNDVTTWTVVGSFRKADNMSGIPYILTNILNSEKKEQNSLKI